MQHKFSKVAYSQYLQIDSSNDRSI